MIRFDAFTFSLPRLWAALFVLLLIDLVILSAALIGTPVLPRPLGAAAFLLGPYILAALWLVVVALAIWFHRRPGLWLLLTALLIVPATYLHWLLVWGCAARGACL